MIKICIRIYLFVGDYYFETNYPGDNFITLDKEDADEAIEIMDELFAYIDNLTKEKT